MCLQASASPSIDFLDDFRLDLAAGQVVHEKERRGALHRNVVDAVIDQVGANGVMDVHLEGDLQLGADAVDARDQNRVDPLRLVHGEQAAEAADFAQNAAGKGLVGEILDPLFGAVGAVNVHTSIGVGDGGLRGIMGHGSQCVSVKWGICQAFANRASRDCSTVAGEEIGSVRRNADPNGTLRSEAQGSNSSPVGWGNHPPQSALRKCAVWIF